MSKGTDLIITGLVKASGVGMVHADLEYYSSLSRDEQAALRNACNIPNITVVLGRLRFSGGDSRRLYFIHTPGESSVTGDDWPKP